MLTTSEPAFGSLIASAPTCSPRDQLGQVLLLLRLAAVALASGSRTGWSARRTTGRPRPRRARSPPSRRCGRGSPCSLPPYSSFTVMPSRPSSPSLRHRSCGNRLSRSMSAARGAISVGGEVAARRRAANRSSSPRSKFRPGSCMCLVSSERGLRAVLPALDGARKIAAYAWARRNWRHNGCKLRHDRSVQPCRHRPSSDPPAPSRRWHS